MAKSPKGKHQPKHSPKKNLVATGTVSLIPSAKVISTLLMVFCFLLYGNTLNHDYTQDDAIVIYDNMYTTQGISGIPGILKYDTFKGFFKVEGKDKLVSGGRYRPFTLIMFAIEWQLFKKEKRTETGQVAKDADGKILYEGRPFISHFINILLYGLTTILVYLLVLNLLSPGRSDLRTFTVALIAALLFAAHPLHTEAVANIKGRDEILTLLGALAAAYYSFQAFYKKNNTLEIAVFVCFFIALMSKENAITFLGVVPLMYWFFTDAKIGKIAMKTLPFFGAAFLFLIIRFSILGADLGDESNELMNNPFIKVVGNQYVDFSLGEKMATIIFTLGKYLQLLVFPHPLTHDYYPRHVEIMGFGNIKVILSLIAYLAMTIYAIPGIKKKDPVSFGILFFLMTTSIISNIVFPVGTNMSERFMFMPSVGFTFILGILGWRLAKKLNKAKPIANLSQLTVIFAITALVTVAFGIKTVVRNMAWKNNYTLFTTDIETSKNSAKLRNAVGGEMIAQSSKPENKNRETEMLRTAQVHLQEAIRIHPNYKAAYLLLGNSSNYLKDYEQAFKYYNQVLAIDANDENGFNNLGITYRDAGKFYGEKGDFAKAEKYLTKALEMRGDEYEILRLLGILNGTRGNHPAAIQYFQKAVNKEPKNAQALFNLSTAYQYGGNPENAQIYLQQARAINPNIGK